MSQVAKHLPWGVWMPFAPPAARAPFSAKAGLRCRVSVLALAGVQGWRPQ